MNGFPYEVIDSCMNSGKDYLAPISWFGNARLPGKPGGGKPEYERMDRPIYSTCSCCPERVTYEWIDERKKKNKKNRKSR